MSYEIMHVSGYAHDKRSIDKDRPYASTMQPSSALLRACSQALWANCWSTTGRDRSSVANVLFQAFTTTLVLDSRLYGFEDL